MSEKYLGENSTPLLINQIKENCTQKRSTLPIASIDELGNTYQYTGTTSGSLVHGYFYECVVTIENPTTYGWQQVNIQPTAGTPTASGTTFDNTTSGLQATNVQDAIDEVDGRVDNIEDKIPSTATSSNQLVDHDSLGTAAFKDSTDRVSPNNTALVESQSVYSAINTALSSIYTPRGDITCAELTSSLLIAANVGNIYETSDSGTTSALFLQGAGVPIATGSNVGIISAGQGRILFNLMANAFDLTDYQKKDLTQAVEGATTVEGALGALSTNKATQTEVSDVKQALTNEAEVRAKAGAHNYLRNDVETHTDSSNYTTYTKNADKSVEVTRTSSSGTYSISYVLYQVAGSIPKGNYILTGCPSGGASNTYKLDISVYSADRSTSYGTYTDTGNGVNVNIPADDCSIDCRIVIYPAVASGGTFSKTFYPMLADAKDAYKGYLPFAPTNAQCLSADANAVLGAHNFFVNTDADRTISGIAITRNNDNSYSVAAGTTSGSGLQFPIKMDSNYDDFEKIADALLPNTTYVFSVGVADANMSLQVYSWEDDPSVTTTLANATSVSEVSFTTPATFKHIYARIYVPISTAVPAMTLKPIIKLASDPSNKLTPYAKTNRELTEKIDIVGNLFTTTTKVVNNITHGIATTIATLENLPIGTYVVSGQFNSDSAMSGGGLIQFVSSGVIQNGASCNTMINQGFKANAGLTGIFNVTNATNQINLQIYTANADLTVVSVKLAAIRIA